MAVRTRRVPLAGSDKAATLAQQIGRPPTDESISATVHLRQLGDSLEPFVERLAEQDLHTRRYLTRTELAQRHGADANDIANVRTFARRHHLHVARVDAARRTVELTGTVHDMEAAFGTSLSLHADERGVFRARSGPLTVPAYLEPVIAAVLGLDNRPAAHAHFRFGRLEADGGTLGARRARRSDGFAPNELAALYDFPPHVSGKGQTVAVIELGGGFRADELDRYFTELGLVPPTVTAVGVGRAANRPTGDPQSADGEVALDIEVIGAIAPGAHIVVYFADNTLQGFADAILAAVHDEVHEPSVISISWGLAENAGGWSTQARKTMDQAFLAAAAVGATVYAAAGDDLATDGVDDGDVHTDYPASSPHVVGCGGTRLTASDGAITRESVWNAGGSGTGGGVSSVYPVPGFQAGVAPPPRSARPPHHIGRGVPDVAGVADPATGYRVLVDGQAAVMGGTSAVAPLWAGLTALLQQKLGTAVAPFLPTLYRHPTAFRDITSGDNDDYRLLIAAGMRAPGSVPPTARRSCRRWWGWAGPRPPSPQERRRRGMRSGSTPRRPTARRASPPRRRSKIDPRRRCVAPRRRGRPVAPAAGRRVATTHRHVTPVGGGHERSGDP